MTDLLVQQLRVRCRSARAGRDDALRVQRRLERVARAELPRVLAGHATDWPDDLVIDALPVALDFDPREHDDATVAVRWASLIAIAVEAAAEAHAAQTRAARRVESTPPSTTAPDAPVPTPVVAPPAPDDADEAPVVPAWLTTLIDLAAAGSAAALDDLADAAIDPARRPALLASLDHEPRLAPLLAAADLVLVRPDPEARPSTSRSERPFAATPAEGSSADASPGVRPTLVDEAGPATVPAQTRDPVPFVGSRTHFASRAAGLVLAYPWLHDLLGSAEARHPDTDPIALRRQALAALAGGERHTDDPLVRWLAGDEPVTTPSPLAAIGAEEATRLEDAADAVLAELAGVIPGFEGSPPDYLRRELMVRPGSIDLAAVPVAITLAPAPLDPILAYLPYPLGLFALPWTSPAVIRLER